MMKGMQMTTYHVDGEAISKETALKVRMEQADERLVESNVVNLYPEFEFQEIRGFGGAMTEASAYLLMQMEEGARRGALEDIFGENGLGMRLLRVHIDSCDFSLDEYQAVPDPIADPELKTFSIERDRKYIIPMLKEAMEVAKEPVSVLLSPWSPPYQWKTAPIKKKNDSGVYGGLPGQAEPADVPQRCNGGSLKPEHYGAWAKYVVKYVQAYLDEGIPVTMLSLQNETVAATNWDSCVWTPEETKVYLKDHLYPELKRAGLAEKIGLFIWDHNKERMIEHVSAVLDEETLPMVQGIAFHWYSGDHFEAIGLMRQKYPDKVLMHSESCALHQPGKAGFMLPFAPEQFTTPERVDHQDAVCYGHDLIGDINAGMDQWIDWNIVVDEQGGPRHVPGGFTSGLIADGKGSYRRPLMYYYIRHFSHYIKPGARRIGYSRFADTLDVTAVRNPDGRYVVVFLNSSCEDRGCYLRIKGAIMRISAPAETISTVILEEDE